MTNDRSAGIEEQIGDDDDLDRQSDLSEELRQVKLRNRRRPTQDPLILSPHSTSLSKGKAAAAFVANQSIGKGSAIESEVDGLLKWAKDLPDDISVAAGNSFY